MVRVKKKYSQHARPKCSRDFHLKSQSEKLNKALSSNQICGCVTEQQYFFFDAKQTRVQIEAIMTEPGLKL